ncbi:serine hydrolase [Sphingomonas bacterium]|uniref:serine hydrolase domain-containing protein n=1 Tax=Sphingomonas bacterium TaxID=1895847 RepID=UPI002611F5B4|nr:serine hydrolase domain-containing protein [Sphingomonas bacterium]MDB5677038.1 serine hydrolase [Sphingomonas bacterium]
MTKAKLLLAALALAGCVGANSRWAPIMAGPPLDPAAEAHIRLAGAEILFWDQAQRDANFPHMEAKFPGHIVKAGGRVHPLPAGAALPIAEGDVAPFMAAQNVSGMIVLQDGKIRLERYARGFDRDGRWTSFSVAKSFTSTLVGAAIRDGYIGSVDDPVTRYIPDLAGSGYDGVTIAQLLTMTSGVKWNEDYTDPNSDVARMFSKPVPAGADPTVAYMRTLPRADPPGTKWVYKTGETNLIGVLVERATKKTLAAYLSEKIWKPWGMERDAFWMTDQAGNEVSGCCLSVGLRDYARMGMFALSGGKGVVPDGWFARATTSQIPATPDLGPGGGYGYQWWVLPGGRFAAIGIFGQSILVDPAKKLVIVTSSAWPKAVGPDLSKARGALWAKLEAAAQ